MTVTSHKDIIYDGLYSDFIEIKFGAKRYNIEKKYMIYQKKKEKKDIYKMPWIHA